MSSALTPLLSADLPSLSLLMAACNSSIVLSEISFVSFITDENRFSNPNLFQKWRISEIELGVWNDFSYGVNPDILTYYSICWQKCIIDVFFGEDSQVQCKHDIMALLGLAFVTISGHLKTFRSNPFGEHCWQESHQSKTFWVSEYGTCHQVRPRWRSMMKSCCSNCHCCGSAQMVQQQLKLVATLSNQL